MLGIRKGVPSVTSHYQRAAGDLYELIFSALTDLMLNVSKAKCDAGGIGKRLILFIT